MPRYELVTKLLFDDQASLEDHVAFASDLAAKYWPEANVDVTGRIVEGEVRWLPTRNDGWSKAV